MAKPSYDEVVAERDTLREKVIDLETELEWLKSKAPPDEEGLPTVPVDGSGWPLKPELQDVRGVKTPAYLRWLAAEHPEIWNAKCGGEPPQAD